MRTAEENAAEFGRHETRDGWALALLVACSVEPRANQGNRHNLAPRGAKISMKDFAREAGRNEVTGKGRIGEHLVRGYYDAWERAAAAGVVESAERLRPEHVDQYEWSFDRAGDWMDFYEPRKGGRPRASVGEIVENRERVAANMTPLQRQQLRDALDDADDEEMANPTRPTGIVHSRLDAMEPGMKDHDACNELARAVTHFEERVRDAGRSKSRRAILLRGGMLNVSRLTDAVERLGTMTEEELEALLEGGNA